MKETLDFSFWQEEIAAVIFMYLFLSELPILLNFPFICFLSFIVF
jgi:hypothetical protein